ncbi:DEAD/DEAH box helicase [Bacillus sp. ISL-47]|uniref:DEAD/DEAH box helicase n=1 Tax=Bacillus sp. ISL-47 TaxID=2819130 RepID=UPI001BEC77B3|nr:DEAD/DEAH box helicase [Bacillus sp. ISL-47]MBT2689527.1 DEAD/DEAH box helicase [Bacillus sp. ISL-47]MBT2708346.1 DEAD/DEAH box helicase [Pseudomonas sp. ISL-84]
MNQLEQTYNNAAEHTKIKILEDVDRYLGSKEAMPTYKEYLSERFHYIDQIWVNVWLNKITTKISKHEKKKYLSDKGYETENVDRKLINHIFRTEMRDYQPFNTSEWLNDRFESKDEEWEDRYKNARAHYLQKAEEERLQRKKYVIRETIEEKIDEIMEQEYSLLYLYIRHMTAKQLASDFKNKIRYSQVDTFALEEKLEEAGGFNSDEYRAMADFLAELTGNIHKTLHWGQGYFEYETYYYVYKNNISGYLSETLQTLVLQNLPHELFEEYEEAYGKPLTGKAVKKLITHTLHDINESFFESIQEEYVEDLLKLADIPFAPDVHKELFEKDLEVRERKKAEELAELQRQKEEEARMLEYVFGQEYSPSLERAKRYVLHIGETNTGKTHHALEGMKLAGSGMYLAPLRLLALEVYDKLNRDKVPCSLKTGEEEKLVSGSKHLSCTVEMFHEKDFFDVIVIDEAQMITDKDRGFSWYKAITKANANEVHIIGSRSAKSMMLQLLGDADIELNEYSRDIPLEVEAKEFKFKNVRKGDALICFSRKRVLETASRLQQEGHSVSMIYGSMPPETRKKQVLRFINGETSVIVSTDAIGMGLNLPIRRIVFLENEKFDGTKRRLLTSQEVKQIAGRAGRKGLYNIGKVSFTKDIKRMKALLEMEDEPVHTFAIAPTNTVFERFQRYYRDLGTFFELWDKFESPKGTKKAALTEERDLYERIRGTEIEAKLGIMDLYGFLHLPFSKKENDLVRQWEETMYAIIDGVELPEPRIKNRNLEELELTYKAIGLHLLFLYRLEQRTEALYWERLREEISDHVHERLKTDIKELSRKCRRCGKKLPWEHEFQICDECHTTRSRKRYNYYRR